MLSMLVGILVFAASFSLSAFPCRRSVLTLSSIAREFHKAGDPMDDATACLIAAPMRGAHEDHAADERQGLDEYTVLEELPTLVTQFQLLQWDGADIVP